MYIFELFEGGVDMEGDLLPDLDRDIRVIDQALDAIDLDRIVSAVRGIGDENIKEGYNTTFWYPRNQPPGNIAEETINELMHLARPPDECIGTEWWLGRLRPGKKLRLHFDRDLTRSRKFGKHEYPLLGSIFYLNSYPNTPTVIQGQIPGGDPKTPFPEEPLFKEEVDAVANRYAVFRGNLLHGVVSKDAVDMPSGEYRMTLLVNYWHVRPMEPICRDFDGSVYRKLLIQS